MRLPLWLILLLAVTACEAPDYPMREADFVKLVRLAEEEQIPESQLLTKDLPPPCDIISLDGKFQILRLMENRYYVLVNAQERGERIQGWFYFSQAPLESEIQDKQGKYQVYIEGYPQFQGLKVTERHSDQFYTVTRPPAKPLQP